jgi:hypothetical protein
MALAKGTLRGSLFRRGEPAAADHARLQPGPDLFSCREAAELAKEIIMVNAAECRRQIRV